MTQFLSIEVLVVLYLALEVVGFMDLSLQKCCRLLPRLMLLAL